MSEFKTYYNNDVNLFKEEIKENAETYALQERKKKYTDQDLDKQTTFGEVFDYIKRVDWEREMYISPRHRGKYDPSRIYLILR